MSASRLVPRRTVAATRVLLLSVCASVASVRPSLSQCPDGTPPPCASRPPRLAAAPASNSVAVLYFATRDTTDLYLAEGLTEDIATGLGRLAPRVEVKAPSSVRRAQRVSPGDLRGIGRALGVRYLVDGGLRRTPAGYRVSIRLVNTQTELTAWGQTYDESSTGLLDLPSAVAQAVAEAIGGSLAPAERTSLAARPTRDPRAWEHVLRGNFLVARRTQEDALRAVDEYQEAIRLDSSYVDAYGALGSAYSLAHNWSWNFGGLPQESLLARAVRATPRALALDSGSAMAWFAAATAQAERSALTLEGVAPAFRRAIALDPRRADPYHQLGITLLLQGDDSGGTAALHQALALEPERPITLTWLANAAYRERSYAAARKWLDSAATLSPGFPYALLMRAVVRVLQGDTVGGLRDANGALRASRGDSLLAIASLAWVEAVARDTAKARLHARIVTSAPGSVLGEASAWAAAALVAVGERDAALAALEHAPRDAYLGFWLGYGVFDPVRSEPRFQRLVEETRPPSAPR
jgi:TolB-like protein/tetratricopeptide (TPR) repeat protein